MLHQLQEAFAAGRHGRPQMSKNPPTGAGLPANSGTMTRIASAPWSPLPLTVDVMAEIVTVPSRFTRPVMLRRPSVAGAHGRPLAGLFPVGYPATVYGTPRSTLACAVYASVQVWVVLFSTHFRSPAAC